MRTRRTMTLCLSLVWLGVAGAAMATPPVTGGLAAWFVADSGLVKADGAPCQDGDHARRWWASNNPSLQVAHSSLAQNGVFRANALNGHATYRFIPNTTMWGQDETANLFPANDPPNYTIFAVVQNWVSGSICRITGYNGASYHSIEGVEINRGYWAPELPFQLRQRDHNYRIDEPEKGFHIEDTNTWELEAVPHIVQAVTVTEPTGSPGIYRGVLDSSNLLLDGVPAGGVRGYYIDPLTELPREPREFHVSGRNLQLGYAADTGGWLDGEIAEVLVYTRALSPAEQVEVGLYLSDKYAIPTAHGVCDATSIDAAKKADEGACVSIEGALVTAAFHDDSGRAAFSIEEPNRTAGIRVVSGTAVAVGNSVNISGTAVTTSGERVIQATTVSVVSSGNPTPAPVAMKNLSSGGGVHGQQGAVTDNAGAERASVGLNNVGVMTVIYGKVTAVNDTGTYAGSFHVNDGSALEDGSGNIGVMCRPGGSGTTPDPLPALDSYVRVTGVVGVTQLGGRNVRCIWTTGWSN